MITAKVLLIVFAVLILIIDIVCIAAIQELKKHTKRF